MKTWISFTNLRALDKEYDNENDYQNPNDECGDQVLKLTIKKLSITPRMANYDQQ